MSPEFVRSAELVARIMPVDADWWIIGSSALLLGGIDVDPKDIDVFAASDMIEAARLALGAQAMPSRSDLFRSTPYFQAAPEGGLEIDFMGGLEVYVTGLWARLHIESKQEVTIGSATLFIPSLKEQADILRLFGRPKDPGTGRAD